MTTPPDLLPCPFCGCDAQFVHSQNTDGVWVECMDPNCSAEIRCMDTKKEAAERWNKRVPVTTLSAYQDDNDASLVAIRITDGFDTHDGCAIVTPNYITITHLDQTTTNAYCFVAYHPELPTVRSQGETPQEARSNLVEATELALEHLAAYGLPVPEAMTMNEGFRVTL